MSYYEDVPLHALNISTSEAEQVCYPCPCGDEFQLHFKALISFDFASPDTQICGACNETNTNVGSHSQEVKKSEEEHQQQCHYFLVAECPTCSLKVRVTFTKRDWEEYIRSHPELLTGT